MRTYLLPIILIAAGFMLGWLGKTQWSVSKPLTKPDYIQAADNIDQEIISHKNNSDINIVETTDISTLEQFKEYLKTEQYKEAVNLYQEEDQYKKSDITELKESLLTYLAAISSIQNNFTELTSEFLSVYYGDIDVLLLLAEFNYNNSAYMEAVNIYQLAKTYAYTDTQQQKVQAHFKTFIQTIDQLYTEQQDWFALSNLYNHVQAAGLLSSVYQYKQAIAYLRSGERAIAIEQLETLQNDSLIGEQATASLKTLLNTTTQQNSIPNNPWQNAEKIALQKAGNQYLINLLINRRDNITLLIDTGASMTTLSRSAFNSLNSNEAAKKVGTRLFQTANGTTKGTVYIMPELTIGNYQISNLPIAVLDFTIGSGVDGLLGMNVLGLYRFQIDQENTQLLLQQK